MRRHPYHAPADAELARWTGVKAERAMRGKHPTLILTVDGRSRRLAYPLTPSDRRGPLNHVRDIRAALNTLGAVQTPPTARHSGNQHEMENA